MVRIMAPSPSPSPSKSKSPSKSPSPISSKKRKYDHENFKLNEMFNGQMAWTDASQLHQYEYQHQHQHHRNKQDDPPSTINKYEPFMVEYNARALADFQTLQRMGSGTYGVVWKAKDLKSGDIVALKRLHSNAAAQTEGFPLTALRELKMLMKIKHRNVVRLLGVAVGHHPDTVVLVLEYVEYDLLTLLRSLATPLTIAQIKQLMRSLLQATQALHSNFIVHRDLKMSNLLISRKGQLKLADFGLARQLALAQYRGQDECNLTSTELRDSVESHTLGVGELLPMSPNVVTLWYRSPEVLLDGGHYSTAMDIWAVGCILAELLNDNAPLFPGRSEQHQLVLIQQLLGTPDEHSWPDLAHILPKLDKKNSNSLPVCRFSSDGVAVYSAAYAKSQLLSRFPIMSSHGIDLLYRLLFFDPSRRLTAKQALAHPWFHEEPLPTPPESMPSFADANDYLQGYPAEEFIDVVALSHSSSPLIATRADNVDDQAFTASPSVSLPLHFSSDVSDVIHA